MILDLIPHAHLASCDLNSSRMMLKKLPYNFLTQKFSFIYKYVCTMKRKSKKLHNFQTNGLFSGQRFELNNTILFSYLLVSIFKNVFSFLGHGSRNVMSDRC